MDNNSVPQGTNDQIKTQAHSDVFLIILLNILGVSLFVCGFVVGSAYFSARENVVVIPRSKAIMPKVQEASGSAEKIADHPEVSSPVAGTKIVSPVTIKGKVPAGWMFEGQFPIKLTDANKKIIVTGTAKEVTLGSWQSGSTVDFQVTMTFTTSSASGFLILENDNPSGDPNKAKTFEIPIIF
jgi:hypothetical protein